MRNEVDVGGVLLDFCVYFLIYAFHAYNIAWYASLRAELLAVLATVSAVCFTHFT